MKKKLFLILTLCLTIALCFSLIACDKGGDGGESGDSTQTGDESSFDYAASAVNQQLEALRSGNGYRIAYEISGSDVDARDTTRIVVGAKGNVYYGADQTTEYYYDLSNDACFVWYEKQGTGAWTKEIVYYDGQTYTKDGQLRLMNAVLAQYSGWLTYYEGFKASMGDDMVKTTATVAGRACDKYTFSAAALVPGTVTTARASYSCSVDKATGICLKWEYSASYGGESATWALTCSEFNANPTFTLPTVSEANTNVIGRQNGQGGSQGEQGHQGEQGNQGNQGGQGEQEVDPGQGEDPGQGGENEEHYYDNDGNEFTPLRVYYNKSDVESAIGRAFANGLKVQYTYKAKKTYTDEYVDITVLIVVKGNDAFVKYEQGGTVNAYYTFGDTTYTAYYYNENVGDYNKDSVEIGYDVAGYADRNAAILAQIFGKELGWDYSNQSEYANTTDTWRSCAVRYGYKGIDTCKFTKEEVTFKGRRADKFLYLEDATESMEHTNGYYIVIDKETGLVLDWHNTARNSFTADVFATGADVTLTKFEHVGFNPGDANDTTTIAYSYADSYVGNKWDALFASGVELNLTYGGKTVTYKKRGDLLYMEYAGVIGILDATETDSYVRYNQKDGEWTAIKLYYEDDEDFVDDAYDYRDKAGLIANLTSPIKKALVLKEVAAKTSGTTKTTGTHDGRAVDQYAWTDLYGHNCSVYMDKREGIVLKCDYYVGSSHCVATIEGFGTDPTINLPEVEILDTHEGKVETHTIYDDIGTDISLQNDIWDLAEGEGIYCAFRVTYSGESSTYVFWAKNNVYSISNALGETYFVVDGENVSAYYFDDGEYARYDVEQWSLSSQSQVDTYFCYHDRAEDDGVRQEETYTIGGTEYDVYRYTYESAELVVDKDTGICLFCEETGAYGSTYEVTELRIGADVDLPEVPEA